MRTLERQLNMNVGKYRTYIQIELKARCQDAYLGKVKTANKMGVWGQC